jgi:hypothetical protein
MVPTSSDELYHHRPDHSARQYNAMNNVNSNANISRPIVAYSSEMAVRAYDTGVVSTPGHRPYDPGAAAVYDRYDATQQGCNPLQQQQRPPPPPPPPSMYGYTTSQGTLGDHEQQVREYHQEAVTQQQQHQMAVAAAAAAGMAAASAAMLKPDGSPEAEVNTAPLYPR